MERKRCLSQTPQTPMVKFAPVMSIAKPRLSASAAFGTRSLHQKIKRGQFPRPIKLSDSGRATGWLGHELIAWQQARAAARDAASKNADDKNAKPPADQGRAPLSATRSAPQQRRTRRRRR